MAAKTGFFFLEVVLEFQSKNEYILIGENE